MQSSDPKIYAVPIGAPPGEDIYEEYIVNDLRIELGSPDIPYIPMVQGSRLNDQLGVLRSNNLSRLQLALLFTNTIFANSQGNALYQTACLISREDDMSKIAVANKVYEVLEKSADGRLSSITESRLGPYETGKHLSSSKASNTQSEPDPTEVSTRLSFQW